MNEEVQIKKPKGRPPKAKVNQKKVGHRKALGRPKGDAAIINEYKARMLASPKSKKVIEAIFDAALDDDHKNQSAAWKLIMDRMLPVSYFEKEATGGRSAVSITISSLGGAETTITQEKDVIEGEVIQENEV